MIIKVEKFIEEYLLFPYADMNVVSWDQVFIPDFRPKLSDPKVIDLLVMCGQENPKSKLVQYSIREECTEESHEPYVVGEWVPGIGSKYIKESHYNLHKNHFPLAEPFKRVETVKKIYKFYLTVLFDYVTKDFNFKDCKTQKEQIALAEKAIVAVMEEKPGIDLPEIVCHFPSGYEEDIRIAFWYLVGNGTIALDNNLNPYIVKQNPLPLKEDVSKAWPFKSKF